METKEKELNKKPKNGRKPKKSENANENIVNLTQIDKSDTVISDDTIKENKSKENHSVDENDDSNNCADKEISVEENNKTTNKTYKEVFGYNMMGMIYE